MCFVFFFSSPEFFALLFNKRVLCCDDVPKAVYARFGCGRLPRRALVESSVTKPRQTKPNQTKRTQPKASSLPKRTRSSCAGCVGQGARHAEHHVRRHDGR